MFSSARVLPPVLAGGASLVFTPPQAEPWWHLIDSFRKILAATAGL